MQRLPTSNVVIWIILVIAASVVEGGICEKKRPCKNGGTCTDKGNDKFECCCAAGWTGKLCDEEDLPPKPPGKQKDCIAESDPRGTMYFGTQDETTTGRKCQAWAAQYPHKHPYEEILASEGNYCRNRAHGPRGLDRPWCFTTDPDKRWEYCDNIPPCSDPDKKFPDPPSDPGCYNRSDKGESYMGPVNFADNGKRCKKWAEHSDNFCRNPNGAKTRPWCWTDDGEDNDCDIPICALPPPEPNENDCRVDKRVATCVGTVTLSGDCYYQYQLQGACSFTAVSVTRQRFEIYFPRRTKELYFEGAGGSKSYTNRECNLRFEVTGYNELTINFPICGWCAMETYDSFMQGVAEGTNTCSGELVGY